MGDLIANVWPFRGDVIGRDSHDDFGSMQASAKRVRQRSLLVIIMRYRDA
jgi:hypothetical protein